MKKIVLTGLLVFGLLCVTPFVAADRLEELEREVNVLKKRQARLEMRIKDLKAQLNEWFSKFRYDVDAINREITRLDRGVRKLDNMRINKTVELETDPGYVAGRVDIEKLKGIYKSGGYFVKIEGAGLNSIKYHGTDGSTYYHTGTLTWDQKENGYIGTLEDAKRGNIADQGREANNVKVQTITKNGGLELSINATTWHKKDNKKEMVLNGRSATLSKGKSGDWPL